MTKQIAKEDRASRRWAIRDCGRDAFTHLRGRVGAVLRFALAFELLRLLVLAPLGAALLRISLERWGRCSVGNFEIIAFLLSPPGLAGLFGVGAVALTTFYLEIAGLILLLADRRSAWWSAFFALAKRILPLLGLGLRQLVVLAAVAAPFLGAIGILLRLLWAGRDLYGLIVLKPPIFWIGLAGGAALATSCAFIVAYLALRWLLALPAVLFEPDLLGGKALASSTRRTRGRLASMLRCVAAWLAAAVLVSLGLSGGLRFGSDWLLDRVGLSLPVLLPVTAVVLIVHAAATALVSIATSATLAAVVLTLYRNAGGAPPPEPTDLPPAASVRPRLPARWAAATLALVLVATVGLVCYRLLSHMRLRDHLEITAHRGGAAVAPENTVAALRKAIEAQADWAEIDVQRTADDALAVLHDSDLVRIGGPRRRVAESTLAEIQSIDVGSTFGEEFRGERVPTLDEILVAAAGHIRLNIELKPSGRNDAAPLTQAVVEAVKRAGLTPHCRLCSQSHESLRIARQLEPSLQVGFIAGGRIGDLSRLQVDFLMVAQRLATRKLVEAARVRGIEVHAWTVNDPDAVAPLLDRGVANIITDDPAAMRRRLEEIQQLSPAERLLLRVRNALAD